MHQKHNVYTKHAYTMSYIAYAKTQFLSSGTSQLKYWMKESRGSQRIFLELIWSAALSNDSCIVADAPVKLKLIYFHEIPLRASIVFGFWEEIG